LSEIEREYAKIPKFGWSLRKRHGVVLFILVVRFGKHLFVFLFTGGVILAKLFLNPFYSGKEGKPVLLFALANLSAGRQEVLKLAAIHLTFICLALFEAGPH